MFKPKRAKSSNKNSLSMKTKNFFDTFDMFGVPIPGFNVEGKTKFGTSTGFVLSIAMTCLVLFFTLKKLQYLVNHENPSLALVEVKNAYSREDSIDLSGHHFGLAFGVQGFYDR